MTKDEAEQFVKKYEKSLRPKGAARPGQEIKLKPTEKERTFDPNRQAPEKLPDMATSTRNDRGGNVVPTDEVHGLAEGGGGAVPRSLRGRVKAYTESLARSPVTAPARKAAAPASAPTTGGSGGTNP
jgi:hypothetical protein